MKDDNLYNILRVLLWAVILGAIIGYFTSCELVEAIAPDDWPVNVADTIPQDSVVIDTMPTDTIIPCTELTEIVDPAFVTLYMLFDDPQDSARWEGGGHQSYNLADIIPHITSLPFTTYQTDMGGVVIIKGTNNHQSFQLKVFARIDGAKWYMGTSKQGFVFPILTEAEYKQAAIDLPSVNYFSFWNTQFDSLAYIEIAETILGDCKKGRWKADFRQSPYHMDTNIIQRFINAEWDYVLFN